MSQIERLRTLRVPQAQKVIHTLMAGEPPSLEVVDLVSVGLEADLAVFEREYFHSTSFLVSPETAGSSFKVVEAYYGGGKTHYLRAVERTAHRHNFASAFVGLKREECPLTRFDQVYAAVAEALTVPQDDEALPIRGMGEVIRQWVARMARNQDDVLSAVHHALQDIGDLPLMSLKVALRTAALAHASGDQETFEEALVYLTSGKIPPALKKQGVLQTIDAKNGSLALRSVAALLRRLGYAGFVFVLDEGDRSLSIVSSKEMKAASNNLVQLINETANEGAWPGTLFLYSIPSWQNFQDAFGHNQALIQRVAPTGFPMVPPAPRIQLDDRLRTNDQKRAFCLELAKRLDALFSSAYPGSQPPEDTLDHNARLIADSVLKRETESTFRRLFVQSYLKGRYETVDGTRLTSARTDEIVNLGASQLAEAGR